MQITKRRLLVAIIVLMFILGCSQTTSEKLAKCIGAKDVRMYGTGWCTFCKAQKDLFGDAFQYITYVNCENERDKCDAKNIHSYPIWEINDKLYPGKRTLENLANISGCS